MLELYPITYLSDHIWGMVILLGDFKSQKYKHESEISSISKV